MPHHPSNITHFGHTPQRLCELARGGSVGELTSLEKVMQQLAAGKQVRPLLLALHFLLLATRYIVLRAPSSYSLLTQQVPSTSDE